MSVLDVAAVQQAVAARREEIIAFLREIVAIPSMDSQIGPVGERVQAEMTKLGFDEVWFDSMGNTVGRIGDGDSDIRLAEEDEIAGDLFIEARRKQ